MLEFKYKFRKNFFLLIFIDIALFTASYAGAYLLRFDLSFPHSYYIRFRNMLIPILVVKLCVFYHFGLYRGMWRYTGLRDLENIVKASLVSFLPIILFASLTYRRYGFARSVFLIDTLLTIFLIGGCRLFIRLFFSCQKKESLPWMKSGNGNANGNGNGGRKRKKVLIVGAGDAAEKIFREINDNKELMHYDVVGFLDDDPNKIHRSIHGVKILGSIQEVVSVAGRMDDIEEIIIAIPSASAEKMRRIIDLCQKTGVKCKTIPSIGELINDKVSISKIRDVSYSDLLGRGQVELDMDKIGAYLEGKCVLVTGAGGSIGSEFCRQVAAFKPKTLVMLDRAESSLYDIEMELKHLYPQQSFQQDPQQDFQPSSQQSAQQKNHQQNFQQNSQQNLQPRIVSILASVTYMEILKAVFNQYEPHVVFHAAAYKHVPMMEIHPWEAVYNNILGTKNVLDAALEAKVERFVLVSTDKAVRPTNIMGASKRVAEIIVQLKHRELTAKLGWGPSAEAVAGTRTDAGTKARAEIRGEAGTRARAGTDAAAWAWAGAEAMAGVQVSPSSMSTRSTLSSSSTVIVKSPPPQPSPARGEGVLERVDGLEGREKVLERVDGLEGREKVLERVDGLEGREKVLERVDGLEGREKALKRVDGLEGREKALERVDGLEGREKALERVEKLMEGRERVLGRGDEVLEGRAPSSSTLDISTKIMAVRFGNVIGSAGSVIPLFKRQIANGGPVTVTHPDVTRYFMTISEAVQLILQAGAMGESGDIYILRMGRPVKILDMARDLIRLSGFEPDKDIDINITGLRPGEKLYEELITEGEGVVPTAHEKLMVLRSNGTGNEISYRDLEKRIDELLILAQRRDYKGIQSKLWELVPEYKPQLLSEDMKFQCERIVDLEDEDENEGAGEGSVVQVRK